MSMCFSGTYGLPTMSGRRLSHKPQELLGSESSLLEDALQRTNRHVPAAVQRNNCNMLCVSVHIDEVATALPFQLEATTLKSPCYPSS
jgi:hypothetical protein